MLGNQPLMGFVATCDAERAKRFYEQVLGLRLVADEPYALVFDAHGTELRIQKVQALSPQPFTALGWQVADIVQVAGELRARGVELLRFSGMDQDELGVWTAPGGARVAWFKDPDGNTLSLAQHRR